MFKIFIFIILLQSISGKYLHYSLDLRQVVGKKWIYITRFASSPGTGTLDARARIKNNNSNQDYIPLEFLVYEEISWGLVQDEQECINKQKLSKFRGLFQMPSDGGWQFIFSSYYFLRSGNNRRSLFQKFQPKFWYFAISDCQGKLKDFIDFKVELEVIFKNSDNSHFSSEDQILLSLSNTYPILYLISFFMAIYMWIKKNQMNQIKYEQNQIYTTVFGTTVLQTLSLAFITLHYIKFYWDGVGLIFCDILGKIFGQFTQDLMCLMILFVSHGWTINYVYLRQNFQFIPLLVGIILTQCVVIITSKFWEFDTFHDYDGIPGAVFLLMRFIIFTLCLYFIIKNKMKSKNIIRIFYERFMLIGILYLISTPILIIFCHVLIQRFLRHTVINIGIIVIQIIGQLIFQFIFTSKTSSYSKINQTGII